MYHKACNENEKILINTDDLQMTWASLVWYFCADDCVLCCVVLSVVLTLSVHYYRFGSGVYEIITVIIIVINTPNRLVGYNFFQTVTEQGL